MSNVRADNFGKRDGSSSIPADTLLQGTAKAWLNLNGTGTIATRDSFNISSVTDVGTGNYGMTFAAAMPNANYAPTFNAASGIAASIYALGAGGADPTVNGCRVIAYLSAAIDTAFFTGGILGDPA